MRRIAGSALVLALLAPWAAPAQERFADRPVSMVVGFPSGGVAEASARPVAASKAEPRSIPYAASCTCGTYPVATEMDAMA